MTESIQTYSNDALGVTVRTVTDESGEPLFVASDVAKALGYGCAKDMTRRLDDDEKGGRSVPTPGGNQTMTVITESGLYSAILGSKLPAAREFKRWVTHDVLPAIRRTGAYGSSAEARMERLLSDGAALIEAQNARIREMEPKAAFAEAVEGSETLHSVGECAKVIGQSGVRIGQKRLFELLRRDGWLMKGGRDRNLPTQRARDMDLIRIQMSHYVDRDGSNCTKGTPRVTGKGMTFFFHVYGLGRAQLALPIPE